MDSNLKRIIAIIAGCTMVVAVFLPAFSFGYGSISLWDGIEGDANGNAIVILLFGILATVFAIVERFDYVQACSIGVFAVGVTLFIDFVRAEIIEFMGIGMILLILASLIGAAAKEFKVK